MKTLKEHINSINLKRREKEAKAAKAVEQIDGHGNSLDGMLGKFGTCSVCGRSNKVIGPLSAPVSRRKCIMPTAALVYLKPADRPKTGCDAQRGENPGMQGGRSH